MSGFSARLREIGSWTLLNAIWAPLSFQDAALVTILIPSAMLALAPDSRVAAVSTLGSITGATAMIVPPLAGALSDRLRRRGGSRRLFVAAGLAIDVFALFMASRMHSLILFGAFCVLATLGANVALAAYQALLPESVPRIHWGAVSGVRGAVTLAGTVLGLGIAGIVPDYRVTFVIAAVIVALFGVSLFGLGEGSYDNETRAHVRDWHDFMVVFAARALVFFGLILLQTFVLIFFRDVYKLDNPGAGTALYGMATLIGAIGSSIYLGVLSDRAPRKLVTCLAGVPMAIATIGFAVSPEIKWMLPFAVLFGVGFGGVISVGWALAMDTIPELSDVARDLGLWGIATNLPNVVAPLVGWWLIGLFHGTRSGYQAVFGLAGFSFMLASFAVLRVGRRPLSSMYGMVPRLIACVANEIYTGTAYRVRWWGRLPRERGPTLLVANHQHDLESMTIVSRTSLRSSWRHPIFTACSRRMYEPGFLAVRLPWLSWLLGSVNAGPLFVSFGMLPLENDLSSRAIVGLAAPLQQAHGSMPLDQIFDDRVASRFPPGTTTKDLLYKRALADRAQEIVKISTLREPYRREILDDTRRAVDEEMATFEDVVRRGGTFYVTPEGHYSVDGKLGPILGIVKRVAPLATVWLAAVSYDPFAPGRLSMMFRLVQLDDREHLREALAAARTVTTSQLLGAWLEGREGAFAESDAIAAVEKTLADLPPQLFVDPELANDPRRAASRAIANMVAIGVLARDGAELKLSQKRGHVQFPSVVDMVSFQANFFRETLANAAYAPVFPA